ncbi:murein L,D-transpeptidase [Microbulbifer flavimaris]|uniref:Murein L,D-transpeptidase n=1 Tax=Microbulbifer flavimaris TaxID=1781068 RepID=A0ABX4I0C9_9GAMM|nr:MULTISPECIES: L,D-transpeptidase family protein [Microbulbifer]PCO05827.1 murein L,D-transpeptidase [Microbulbifer flavimaris]
MGVGNSLNHFQVRSQHCSAAALALFFLLGTEPLVAGETPEPGAAAATELTSPDPFTPYGRQHALMREELARYQALAGGDLWQPLPKGQTLAPGAREPRVLQLRSLMMLYGDLPLHDHDGGDGRHADEYDPDLQAAVRRFQRRHGLREDGLVDERTRARLNVAPADRAHTLAANLSRLQQLPRELGPRYILVNIPDFSLRLMEQGREQYRMRVVVGKPKHATPQLSTRMTRVVFNPIWRVPPSIALKELLPKGSAALRAKGFRLVSHSGRSVPFTSGNIAGIRRGKVSLHQRGGPENALGRVKFVIPNRDAIFLHDTNSKHLFKRPQRAFSHGCIRLEKPLEFARMMLLEQNEWQPARAEQYLNSGRTRAVTLKKPLPVYIAYWTAWVDEDGLLQFRPDIYERDGNNSQSASEKSAGPEQDQPG